MALAIGMSSIVLFHGFLYGFLPCIHVDRKLVIHFYQSMSPVMTLRLNHVEIQKNNYPSEFWSKRLLEQSFIEFVMIRDETNEIYVQESCKHVRIGIILWWFNDTIQYYPNRTVAHFSLSFDFDGDTVFSTKVRIVRSCHTICLVKRDLLGKLLVMILERRSSTFHESSR